MADLDADLQVLGWFNHVTDVLYLRTRGRPLGP